MVHRAASTDPDAASPLVTIGESTAAASMSAATTFLTGPTSVLLVTAVSALILAGLR